MRQTIACLLMVGLLTAVSAGQAMAPVSVEGDATFVQAGNNWTITTATDKTAINWTGFNVAQGATVHFQQPGASSSVMNTVLGSQASYINGLLSSNGGVYLINPNGITIGPSGSVNVARFVATTLSVPTADFLAGGDLNFRGASQASVENYGKIEAIGGDVYLIARSVVNRGTIKALSGSANLVAGLDVLLTQDDGLFVRPSPAEGTGLGVDNSGMIEAVLARLEADGNMYALAINNTGVVRATSSEIAGGRVLLRAEGGSVVNSGILAAPGGEIDVLGENVAVTGGAVIDASGDAGGGQIRIGGDMRGANPDVLNAKTTSLGAGTRVAADALVAGDGGKVIVWSDDVTEAHGTISAEGAGGGIGGFIETSGREMDLLGLDLFATGGTWLIDPPVIIGQAEADAISAALDIDMNILRDGSQVVVNAPIRKTQNLGGTPILWLRATKDLTGDGTIAINADIDLAGGQLRLDATDGATQAAGTTLTAASFQVTGAGTFLLNQPTNDFGIIGVSLPVGGLVRIEDVNDLTIGKVGSAAGARVLGGELHISTPNGNILCNGLLGPDVAKGYHAIGYIGITESSVKQGSYEMWIWNLPPESVVPGAVETFINATLLTIDGNGAPIVNMKGSAAIVDFIDLIGDTMGYGWNFRVAEAFGGVSPNDYAFAMVSPVPGLVEELATVESARTAAIQDFNQFSWQTGWARDDRELDHVHDGYTLSLGSMNVDTNEVLSALYVNNITFTGHPPPAPALAVFDRIFDHVEDFPHVRPAALALGASADTMAPTLGETSTYFDQSLQQAIFYDASTKAVDPRYYYQSVGSIYQIPR